MHWRVWRSDLPVEKKIKESLEKKKNGGGWGYGERDHTVKGEGKGLRGLLRAPATLAS